jgi:UPF0755 protein
MKKQKRYSCLGLFLLTLLLIIGIVIIWVAIPILAEKTFGAPSAGLTPLQVRQYGLKLLLAKNDFIKPNPFTVETKEFEIVQGSSVIEISDKLQTSGLIRNRVSFRNYLIYKGIDSKIRSGTFFISNTLSPMEIAEQIRSDNPVTAFYLYPGWRADEVANALIMSGVKINEDEFMRVVNNPHDINLPDGLQNLINLEGFLFPGEYEITKDASVEEIIGIFVDRFYQRAYPLIMEYGSNSGLSMSEIITMASIIQRESLIPEEQPMIASVFYNRLASGMKLETDPTVQYAIGYDIGSKSWWKNPLGISDLEYKSPFNTYINYGLPPHPISNPGLDAIKAALLPESSTYYYFQAACDHSGTHIFSKTFEEHLSHNCP